MTSNHRTPKEHLPRHNEISKLKPLLLINLIKLGYRYYPLSSFKIKLNKAAMNQIGFSLTQNQTTIFFNREIKATN